MKEKPTSQSSSPATQRENNVRKSSVRARWIAKTGILSAAAIALMYLEFSLPFFPGFLKFDFSEVPALLATFSMGPLTGIVVEFIKNLAHLLVSHTAMVGELANFIMGSAFVGVAGLIYRYNKTKKGAMISLAAGTAALTISGCLVNYFITIPFYINVTNISMDTIATAAHAVGNPFVKDMTTLIFYVFVPFNLLKGLVISIIISLIYKKLSPLLHR